MKKKGKGNQKVLENVPEEIFASVSCTENYILAFKKGKGNRIDE